MHPRLASVRLKPDGSFKVRPVDHFSWCPGKAGKADSVNGFTCAQEKLKHESLDLIVEALKVWRAVVRCIFFAVSYVVV